MSRYTEQTSLIKSSATPQWFADVEGIKSRAKQALDSVHFYPTQCEYWNDVVADL